MNKSETIVELAKALSRFQGEVKQPKKDKINPHFKSNFVSLDGVVEAITETASKHGLSFIQFPVNNGEQVGVYTVIMHDSGEWIESEPIFTNLQKKDPQGVGSALTYLRRYSLSAVFGITSEEDNDAEGAMDRGNQQSYNNNQYKAPQQSKPSYTPPSNIKVPESAQEAGSITLSFGKNKGKTLKQLWVEDKNYLMWLLDNDKTDEAIKEGISLMQVAAAQAAAEQKMQ